MIIDREYFYNEYGGKLSDTEETDRLLSRAETLILSETGVRDTAALPDLQAEAVKKAVCAEAEFLDANGGTEWLNEAGRSYVHLGKFSTTAVGSDNPLISETALRILAAAGLRERAVKLC